MTIMTEEASSEVLAHEIGHHLFVRPNPDKPNQYFDDNPDTAFIAADASSHDKRSDHLMNIPVAKNETVISPIQCESVSESKLVKEEEVLIGYDAPPGVQRCSVTFEKMHVYDADDGLSDSHLESSWNFYAYEKDAMGNKTANFFGNSWIESDLFGPKDYDLNFMGTAIIDLANTNNTLEIQVDGSESDDFSDDDLPVIKKSYRQADMWGKGSHPEHGHNDEITYDVFYTIQSDPLVSSRFERSCQARLRS
jgi:hypothetical protein